MAHRLKMGDVLAAIDRHDLSYLSSLDEHTRRGFAPPVILRMASTALGETAPYWLLAVNERANVHFWDCPPDLQYRLLASCGLGRRERRQWIEMAGRRGSGERLREFLRQEWPGTNDLEIDILLAQMDAEQFRDLVRSRGCTPQEEKELVTAYERYSGKAASKGEEARD